MKVRVIAFGKLKAPGLREAADYYKRLSKTWLNVEEIELKPIPVPDKSSATRLQIQEKESQLLIEKLKSECRGRSLIILLDEIGKSKSTLDWAKEFQKWESEGVSSVSFCVGSSLGFSKELRELTSPSSVMTMSLGPQTLPHELARVVLFEQIYRIHTVIKGHPYHNEG